MKKNNYRLFGWGLTIALLLQPSISLAQNLPPNETNDNSPAPVLTNLSNNQSLIKSSTAVTDGSLMLSNLRTARQELQDRLIKNNKQPTKPTFVTSYSAPVEITLALWQEENNQLIYLSAYKAGNKIQLKEKSDYQLEVTYNNGVNSQYRVTGQPTAYVLAVIHPIYHSQGTTQRPFYRLENVVYAPFHDYLLKPALITAGQEYFANKIAAVYEELRVTGVRSYAYPKELLADVLDPALVKVIIAIEHVSAHQLLNNNHYDYLSQFYVTLAGNEQAAYAYAKSSASARGLVQFIPTTYQSLRKLQPGLTLPTDFVQGMTDPYNAIKAAIGLMDYNLIFIPSNLRTKEKLKEKNIGALLAAIYNGGPSRLRKALAVWGENWDKLHSKNSLKLETVNYVAKYELVYDHFASGEQMFLALKP
ncbi:transglycosylase SLT domain-containing protein [Patescibacteria group bacterium]|nr:transglycosylase SLT domain-containing protein [Patescibacteria group bacterium]